MKGDIYECPKCGNTIQEGDCAYTEVVCNRTVNCRQKGGTDMKKKDKK